MAASTLSSHAGRVFDVDQLTGDITVVGLVDREVTPVYRLLISARDRGDDPAASTSADAIVVVRVTDANDNSPTISINTLLEASVTTYSCRLLYLYFCKSNGCDIAVKMEKNYI